MENLILLQHRPNQNFCINLLAPLCVIFFFCLKSAFSLFVYILLYSLLSRIHSIVYFTSRLTFVVDVVVVVFPFSSLYLCLSLYLCVSICECCLCICSCVCIALNVHILWQNQQRKCHVKN